MSKTVKKFLMKYNGWLGFAVATLLFFAAPPLYRLIDPTAGQFDAGYIHPIIYAAVVVCFASGLSFLLLMLSAPGLHKGFDKYMEEENWVLNDQIKFALILYLAYFISICATVWFMV